MGPEGVLRSTIMRASVFAVLSVLLFACGSSSSDDTSGSSTAAACADVSGTWTVSKHCDASLVGMKAVITEKDCALTFAAPFDGFSGTVTKDGKISLSGPQSCTGTTGSSAIDLACTPGTCAVTLSR